MRTPNVSRLKAQAIVSEVFGERFFARKRTKTRPGARCEIGRRKTVPPFRVEVLGAGDTWLEAVEAVGVRLGLADVAKTASDLRIAYVAPAPVTGI